MIMYMFDRRWNDRSREDGTATAARHAKGTTVDESTVEADHTIPTIAVFIVKRSKDQKIRLLRLCGHGNAGFLQLGKGLDFSSQTGLRKLANEKIFASDAVVEIHGCGVASDKNLILNPRGHHVGSWRIDGKGHRFLKAMAKTLGVTVRAGVCGQEADQTYKYECQVVTVTASGSTTLSGKHGPHH
jgi:hypothetical protein